MKLKKGDLVRCIESRDKALTEGASYLVLASEGDKDFVCGGVVLGGGFIIACDEGDHIYCRNKGCLFGDWELVK